MIETKTIDNFLSDAEINVLEYNFKNIDKFIDYSVNGKENSTLQIFIRENNYYFEDAKRILEPKIKQHFHNDIFINQAHVLTSYIPYTIHTDARGGYGIPSDTHQAAWTFIIPLDDYDSSTIVFEQEADEGVVMSSDKEYASKYNWKQVTPDKEFHNKYLTHVNITQCEWYTPESVFKWKKGSNFAASRKKFHVSDNFPERGVKEKRGIIMWTTIPK